MGRKQRKRDRGTGLGTKLPTVTPNAKCKLRLLKLERIKDYLLMEEEFVQNQERLKPQDNKGDEDHSKVQRSTGSALTFSPLSVLGLCVAFLLRVHRRVPDLLFNRVLAHICGSISCFLLLCFTG